MAKGGGPRHRMYLVLGMRLEQKDVHHGELASVSVLLEFLSYPGSDVRSGHRHVVHGLNFRSLKYLVSLRSTPNSDSRKGIVLAFNDVR